MDSDKIKYLFGYLSGFRSRLPVGINPAADLIALTSLTCSPHPVAQVGEFEFAGSVRVCAALSAWSGGAATRLLCADDRGRLHCLLVDLEQVAPAPAPTAGSGDGLDM